MNDFVNNTKTLLLFYETEISQLKKIIIHANIENQDKDLIIKYSIPIFYSQWEGFFVKGLTEYINYINSKSLKIDEVKDEILTYCLDEELHIGILRTDFEKLIKHMSDIRVFFEKTKFYLSPKVDTKSNLNYKVANTILNRLCLNKLPSSREKGLDKLLIFRNNIAHGECSVPSNYDIIDEMSNTVINCIYDLFLIIEDGINNKRFKIL